MNDMKNNKTKTALISVTLLLGMAALHSFATKDMSFSKAKRLLSKSVYNSVERRVTLYCGCAYNPDNDTDLASCGYTPSPKFKSRAHRIEWEHVVPASKFGKTFDCWNSHKEVCPKAGSGRKCCGRTDSFYKSLEADMHNLFPAIGQINAIRSNYPYEQIPGEVREFGACDFEYFDKTVEPSTNIYGEIARASLYMNARFRAETDRNLFESFDIRLFKEWSSLDPPGAWEIERNQLIGELQGNTNPFIGEKE